MRTQTTERSAGALAAKSSDIWGGGERGTGEGGVGSPSASHHVLTQRGFMILVKLIEELQFEKELEQDKGVGLVPGPVCVV